MKKKVLQKAINKTTAVTLAVLIICCGTAALASDSGDETVSEETDTSAQTVSTESNGVFKDETVYVLANTDGSVKKVIVSDWIKNSLAASNISDTSELSDIKNVKGDESYTMNSDNMKVWDAEGNDIYYQGDISKEIPVDLSLSYMLDGKKISAEELAGKSGKVTIRFDYSNNQYENVNINGEIHKIYVPFFMLTGMILDNDTFSNVDVSNGKMINDGDNSVVIGIALPGLQSNLGISNDDFEIPDYVEITADVTDFSMGTTMTLATNEMFNELDLDGVDSLDELTSKMGTLTDSMKQLIDGSSELYGYMDILLSKSKELVSGIDTLAGYSKQLTDAASQLDNGVKSQLLTNNTSLTSGAEKVFNELLSTAKSTLEAQLGASISTLTGGKYSNLTLEKISVDGKTMYQYEAVLNYLKTNIPTAALAEAKIRASLSSSGATDTPTQNAAMSLIYGYMTEGKSFDESVALTSNLLADAKTMQSLSAVSASATSDVTTAYTVLATNYSIQNGQLAALCTYKAFLSGKSITEYLSNPANVQSDAVVAQNAGKVANEIANAGSADTLSRITALCSGVGTAQIKPATDSGIDSALAELSGTDANPGFKYLYEGITAYTTGVSSVSSNLEQYTAKMKEFNNGMTELDSSVSTLVPSVSELKNGTLKISNGLKEFNEKGVKKLVDAVNGDLGDLVARLRATVDVSKDYKSFSGISDDMDGSVKFIYKTDSIG